MLINSTWTVYDSDEIIKQKLITN